MPSIAPLGSHGPSLKDSKVQHGAPFLRLSLKAADEFLIRSAVMLMDRLAQSSQQYFVHLQRLDGSWVSGTVRKVVGTTATMKEVELVSHRFYDDIVEITADLNDVTQIQAWLVSEDTAVIY